MELAQQTDKTMRRQILYQLFCSLSPNGTTKERTIKNGPYLPFIVIKVAIFRDSQSTFHVHWESL